MEVPNDTIIDLINNSIINKDFSYKIYTILDNTNTTSEMIIKNLSDYIKSFNSFKIDLIEIELIDKEELHIESDKIISLMEKDEKFKTTNNIVELLYIEIYKIIKKNICEKYSNKSIDELYQDITIKLFNDSNMFMYYSFLLYCAQNNNNNSLYLIAINFLQNESTKYKGIQFLKNMSNYINAVIKLGEYYYENNDKENSYKTYYDYLKLNKSNSTIYIKLLNNYFNDNKFDNEKEIYKLISELKELDILNSIYYLALYNDKVLNNKSKMIKLLEYIHKHHENACLYIANYYKSINDYDKMIEYYNIVAKKNNVVALKELAEYYLSIDIDKSVYYYKLVAEFDDLESNKILIKYLDAPANVHYLIRCARLNDIESIIKLGKYYESIKSLNEMETLYYIAYIKSKNINFLYNIAYIYNDHNNYSKALYYLEICIANNHIDSLSLISRVYLKLKDYELMKKYSLMAIENGNISEISYLAYYYLFIEDNFDKAIKLFEKQIKLGDYNGYYSLGYVYYILKNEEKSLYYFSEYIKNNKVLHDIFNLLKHYIIELNIEIEQVFDIEQEYNFLLKISENYPETKEKIIDYISSNEKLSKYYEKMLYMKDNKFINETECMICFKSNQNDNIQHVKLCCSHSVCTECFIKIDVCPYRCNSKRKKN